MTRWDDYDKDFKEYMSERKGRSGKKAEEAKEADKSLATAMDKDLQSFTKPKIQRVEKDNDIEVRVAEIVAQIDEATKRAKDDEYYALEEVQKKLEFKFAAALSQAYGLPEVIVMTYVKALVANATKYQIPDHKIRMDAADRLKELILGNKDKNGPVNAVQVNINLKSMIED